MINIDLDKLRKLREENNYSYKNVAMKIKIAAKKIEAMENGEMEIDEKTLKRFLKLYNVSIENLQIKHNKKIKYSLVFLILLLIIIMSVGIIKKDLVFIIVFVNVLILYFGIKYIFVNKTRNFYKTLLGGELKNNFKYRIKDYFIESITISSIYSLLLFFIKYISKIKLNMFFLNKNSDFFVNLLFIFIIFVISMLLIEIILGEIKNKIKSNILK